MVCGRDDLPLAPRDWPWDADAARKRMREWASDDDGNLVPEKFQQGHFWYDDEKPENVTSYKLPFADVIDGELQAVPRGIFAVAAVLMGARGGIDIPEEEKEKIKQKVSKYYEKMELVAPWDREERSAIGVRKRAVVISPESYDVTQNKVTVVWSTGARVKREDWRGAWYEELVLDGARLERLNSVGVLLVDHEPHVRSVIGRVVPGSARIEGNEGIAEVVLSDAPEDAAIVEKIKSGLLPGVSVGYLVYREERVKDPELGEVIRVLDWEPYELSVVALPADMGARVRTFDREVCKMEKQDVLTERQRAERILRACRILRLSPEHAERLIASGMSEGEAIKALMDVREKEDAKYDVASVYVTRDETQTQAEGIVEYLCHRGAPQLFPMTERAREWVGCSLLDIARHSLRARGISVKGLSRDAIADMALRPVAGPAEIRQRGWLTTGDFPYLLGAVAGKTLRKAYEEHEKTFPAWCVKRTVPDYKPRREIMLSEAPDLALLPEGAEYQTGVLHEGNESWRIATYGVMLNISRQALINDDTQAFSRVPQLLGAAAARKESDIVYGLITSNPEMSDGHNLFSNAHHNVADSGGAPSVDTVAAGRVAMRLQRGLNNAVLNLVPSFLLVPAALEVDAAKLIATVVPNEAQNVTPEFVRSLRLIVEPRLDATGTKAWYLIASPTQIDTIVYGYLEGQDGPYVETYVPFDYEGVQIKVRHDFGAGIVDYRGFYKNPGPA